jgi:hypothetical protein
MYKNISKWDTENQRSSSKNLSEKEIKQIADDFLQKHTISLSNYGKPNIETNTSLSSSMVDSYSEE